MNRRPRTNVLTVGLGILMLAQVGLIAYSRAATAVTPGDRPTLGDDIGRLAVTDIEGRTSPLAGDASEPTLLMVFHSECGHCTTVAPAWRDWLDRRREGVRVLALSREPIESAVAYASDMGWHAPVASVTVAELGGPEHGLTSRTPWLFLIDASGEVLFEAQGAGLEALDAALGGLVPAHSAQDEQ